MLDFFLFWVGNYLLVMFCMCLDNIFWISASPEYNTFKKLKWIFNPLDPTETLYIEGNHYLSKWHYILKYRVLSVLKQPRDIIPAIISSMILTLVLI